MSGFASEVGEFRNSWKSPGTILLVFVFLLIHSSSRAQKRLSNVFMQERVNIYLVHGSLSGSNSNRLIHLTRGRLVSNEWFVTKHRRPVLNVLPTPYLCNNKMLQIILLCFYFAVSARNDTQATHERAPPQVTGRGRTSLGSASFFDCRRCLLHNEAWHLARCYRMK